MSNSLRPHRLWPTRLLRPWDSPGKNTGVVAISLSRGSSRPRDRTWVPHIAGRCFTLWAIKEAQILEKAKIIMKKGNDYLAWKIPWTEKFRRLQSMGSQRVRHDWATSLSLFTFMHWRRKWQPTLVFFPGESQGRGSLVGFRLWGRIESDTTKVT